VKPDAFSEIEPLGNAHIHVDEGRGRNVVAARNEVYLIEMTVTTNVRGLSQIRRAIVNSVLCPENTAKSIFHGSRTSSSSRKVWSRPGRMAPYPGLAHHRKHS